MTELHIVPDFSGGGGVVKVIVGVVLVVVAVVVAIYAPELAPYLGLAANTVTSVAGVLFSLGATLALGGLLELLSPAPKTTTPTGSDGAKYLGAPQNTTAVGTPIPIGFGRFPVYGQYLSFNIQADLTQGGVAETRQYSSGVNTATYGSLPGYTPPAFTPSNFQSSGYTES